ncbi:MAG: 2-amino-4-hydroxy-6-hydroxymethyldihydropteridine diphosphokinase [Candidatus Peregrinibacteria bacterium]
MSFLGIFGGGTEVVLSLGSNMGDRKFFMEQGIFHLKQLGSDIRVSSLWDSPPWAGVSTHNFLNAVMIFQTDLSPRELWKEIQTIETAFGKQQDGQGKWGNKNLDIDVVFYGTERINSPNLEIPHKFAKDRAFVLAPLIEIAPDFKFFNEHNISAKDLYEKQSEYQKKNTVIFSSETLES